MSVARLQRALNLLRAESRDDLSWLADAIDKWLAGGCASIEEALGLIAAPGQRSALTVNLQQTRDDALRELAQKYFGHLCAKQRADEIFMVGRRYMTTAWPRERLLEECPKIRQGRPEELIWKALKARPVLPKPRRIIDIISDI